MKKLTKILAFFLALTLITGSMLGVSAAKYVANVVSEDFEEATKFLIPGDLNANGEIENDDYESLRGLILNGKTAQFSDVNGIDGTDIRDLVLQDINSKSDFVANGVMNLNGKSFYNAEMGSVLSTGAEYKLTYNASEDVEVKLVGISGAEVTASGDTFKTPLNLSNAEIQLYVVGEGTVEQIAITRINMDNDYAVN